MLDNIKTQCRQALIELADSAQLKRGDLVVIGCSSSEVLGEHIGKASSPETGQAIFDSLYETAQEKGLILAAQCCEHLNRALIVERETANGLNLEIVSVRPVPKAGGSFATAAFKGFKDPVAVEFIKADAGLDIGGTLIGMHLKHVAVPLRLSIKAVGKAPLSAAKTRPKLIGGVRAEY